MAAATAVAFHQQRTPAWQVEVSIVIGAPNRRVADLEFESAIHKGAVFGFIMLFAAIKQAKVLVKSVLVLSPHDTITAEQINKGTQIDTHYGAIAANSMEQSIGSDCAAKGTGQISKVFGLSWKEALEQEWVHNLVNSSAVGRSMSELGAEHDKLKKCETMLRFWRWFLLRKVQGLLRHQWLLRVHARAVHQAWHGHFLSTGRVERGSAQVGGLPRKEAPERYWIRIKAEFNDPAVPHWIRLSFCLKEWRTWTARTV